MAPVPRHPKFIWVSWLTAVLAGEAQCVYAPWFKSTFKYTKLPETSFDKAAWTADHTVLLEKRRIELKRDGWTVSVENANKFFVKGQAGILAGKPDLVSVKGDFVRVSDAKSGQQRGKDFWQVLIYMFAVPLAFRDLCEGKTIEGEVVYKTGPLTVGSGQLTPERRDEILKLLREIGSDAQPTPIPSSQECSLCEVAECVARVSSPVQEAVTSEW